MIKNCGVWEDFAMPGKKPYRAKHWYRGRCKYWIIMSILNRTRVGWKYPKKLIG